MMALLLLFRVVNGSPRQRPVGDIPVSAVDPRSDAPLSART
jgi:hypothetical protein